MTNMYAKTGAMDFRDWVSDLEREGQLVQVHDEVDPLTEAGAVMRLCNERRLPAQWFRNPKNSLKGSSLLGGPFATKERLAMAFRLPATIPRAELTEVFAKAMHSKSIAPEIVKAGRCQENVFIGEQVDLTRLPVPKLHPQDGGPYVGTLNIGVCKDPDSAWVNWGTYRSMLHDKRSAGLWLGPLNQGGQLLKKYQQKQQVMHYAMFVGGDPMHNIVASASVAPNASEVDVVGGIRGEPVRLVKCRTVDLYVPENAEIVIEGTVTPGDELPEGPFGEYPGYVVSGSNLRPVLRVTALTYRTDPILPAVCLGVPVDDSSVMWTLEVATTVKAALREKGIPIIDVAAPEIGGGSAIVVSTRTPYAGIPQLIASVAWTDRNAMYFPYVIVVDDDVDPWNIQEVFHAMCTKCNPIKDVHVYPGHVNSPLAPYMSGNNPLRELGAGGGNILLDCTWPIDWAPSERPHRLAFENSYSPEIKEKVLRNIVQWGLSPR